MLPLFDTQAPEGTALPAALEQAFARGAVVLTANLRAARALQASYADLQQAQSPHAQAWAAPALFDWSSWVSQLYDQCARRSMHAPVALTPLQEQQLWKQVQDADRARVVAPERMAELAREAYALLSAYRAHPLLRSAAVNPFGESHEDAQRFLVWCAAFDRLCQQQGWLSSTRREEALAASAHLLNPVAELCLVGFDRTTPSQAALLQALQAQGAKVSHYTPPGASSQPLLMQAVDPRQELEACAWWCRERLAAPEALRIAIITPDLARTRGAIDRAFRRILMPQTTLWETGAAPDGSPLSIDPPMPYEFSLGSPLSTFPGIRAALLILKWLQAPLAAAELTWLLTAGPLAGSAADRLGLARLDAELRRDRVGPQVSMASLLQPRYRRHLPAGLHGRLHRLHFRAQRERLVANDDHPARRSYAAWSELAASLLADAGWPGAQADDSLAWQAQQRWSRLLGELAQLGFDGAQPTWRDYLQTLDSQAHEIIFAAESHSAPIQILGPYESSGQTFDAVWFLGADDQQWPSIGRPHPLLPLWLQRQALMPHAVPEDDWRLAQQATERVLASASAVIFSYAAQLNGIAQRPSPLLAQCIGDTWHSASSLIPEPSAVTASRLSLDYVADDSGTLAWPSAQSAGGAEVLKRQAACAFQSFATRRLQAQALEDAEAGLDPRDRGTLVHAVLERLWSPQADDPMRLHTRDDLERATRDGSVTALVTHHVDAALVHMLAGQHREAAGDPWHRSYFAVERERLRDRVLAWLQCELARQPFSVAALEQSLSPLRVGMLQLNVRPDRLDQLADGTHLLLDYKTGSVATSAWDGDRPQEPQLPLYALFGQVPMVSGVAFGQLRAGDTKLLARAENISDQVSASLGSLAANTRYDDEIRDSWRAALLALADQFAQGDAAVDPRDGVKTCEWCPLTGLCRVRALGLTPDDDDELAQDADDAQAADA